MLISAKEIANRWQLTQRRIAQLCYLSFKDAHYEKRDMYQALRYAVKKEFRRYRELLDSGLNNLMVNGVALSGKKASVKCEGSAVKKD